MRRILVTAVSGDIGYGILKILKSPEHILYGCDCHEINNGIGLCDYFVQAPLANDDGYIDFIYDLCKKNEISYLIPCNELEISKIAKHRERFEDAGLKLLIQRNDILDICLDKKKTALFLAEKNFRSPKIFDNIKYICKPIHSNGSKGIRVVDVNKELRGLDGEYIIQEYLEGEGEYTVGVFSDGHKVQNIQFKRELKNGYSYTVKLVNDEKLSQIATRLAEVFALKGFINFQCIHSNGDYYIFEINPRISGTVRFRDMLGFRDVIWWLDLVDGKEIPDFICTYKNATGIRELNEKFILKE